MTTVELEIGCQGEEHSASASSRVVVDTQGKATKPNTSTGAGNPVDFTLLQLIHKRHQFCSPKEVIEHRMIEKMVTFLLIKEMYIWILFHKGEKKRK